MSELEQLAADLTSASTQMQSKAYRAVKVGAQNVQADARRFSAGLSEAPHYPRAITHDAGFRPGSMAWAEIGPDKDLTQGALGNLLEYGSVNNPPYAHLGPALDLEGPRFERALGDAGEEL